MGRLFFASFFTLGILSSFVFGIVICVLLYTDFIGIEYAIGGTVLINFILWLCGPFFSDLIQKFFYKTKFLSADEVRSQYPEIGEIIDQVATKYKFKFPKVGIIADRNPTAFTYGSARFNSRIIITQGIFEFLEPQERKAVVAHELAHIVNRDFIVMMIASTLLQIIYEIYASLKRAKGKKAGGAKAVAAVAFVLYTIGTYLLFYLSRTREYLADRFAASVVSPQDLANALIKIAYGIIIAKDDDNSKRLLQSTRHLGIVDVKNAKYIGVASHISGASPEVLSRVMVFDQVNPWAKLLELNSTHPLTGNRIKHLSDIAKSQNQPFIYDVDAAVEAARIDWDHIYSGFATGLIMFLLPFLLTITAAFFLAPAWLPAVFGIGLLAQIFYKFPSGAPLETTILEEMSDPYASPLRGTPVKFYGEVIGRGNAGYMFDEDMMYKDNTGLIFLDYNSAFGGIGDFFFALTKVKTLFGQSSTASGWFFRGMGSTLSLKYLQTDSEKINSHPFLWSLMLPVILIGLSVWIYLAPETFTKQNFTTTISSFKNSKQQFS